MKSCSIPVHIHKHIKSTYFLTAGVLQKSDFTQSGRYSGFIVPGAGGVVCAEFRG